MTWMLTKVLEQAEEEDFGMSTIGQVIFVLLKLTRIYIYIYVTSFGTLPHFNVDLSIVDLTYYVI